VIWGSTALGAFFRSIEHYGYRSENIQILTDAKGSNKPPTRDNIVSTPLVYSSSM
jgi:hypothetical protein